MSRNLLVITGIFPPDSGGPAKFSYDFALWCANRDLQVNVVTYSDKSGGKTQSNAPFSLFQTPRIDSLIQRYCMMIGKIGRKSRKSTSIIAVGAFLETYIASLIFGFKYVAKVPGDIVWERARNNEVSDLTIEEFQKIALPLKYKIFRWFFTHSLLRATVVVVPSNGLYSLCRSWGVPEYKLRLIRNSIDIEKYGTYHQVQQIFDVITVCRLVPWKGVDELIQYCSNQRLALAVIGDGPEREKLEILSNSLGANVKFFGDIQTNEVIKLLEKSRVFVLNSSYEGLPHALVEARATGLVTVARDETGSSEVINDGIDGFLVRKDRNFSETMGLALAVSAQSNDMGQKARHDSQLRFNRKVNFQNILNLLIEAK
jgi:glycosyltransferase involved in cell wall biosynthesis